MVAVLGLTLAVLLPSPTIYRNPPQVDFRAKGVQGRIAYMPGSWDRRSILGVPVETRGGKPDSMYLQVWILNRDDERVLRRVSLKGPQGRHEIIACERGGGQFCAALDLGAKLCAVQAEHIGLLFELPDGETPEEILPVQFQRKTELYNWFGKLVEGAPLYSHARKLTIAEVCAAKRG